MRPAAVRAEIKALAAAGLNDCEISRRTRVPRTTVRGLRETRYVPRGSRLREAETCPRCWARSRPMVFTPGDYCELLGLYLGDGCISASPRTMRLRVSLDCRYPSVIRDTRALLTRCMPENRVDVVLRGVKGSHVDVSSYSKHWPCVLPQHGPGKKHERAIVLEDWQQSLASAAPDRLLRGLIRSDGCVFVNRTDVDRASPHQYLSYAFSNMSKGIVEIFTAACEALGVRGYRVTRHPRTGLWSVRINRREDVTLMLRNVGRKS